MARKILFVCIKNSSRSPMAAALLKTAAPEGVEIHSAGLTPGKQVHPCAVEAMNELGCDLFAHRPRHVSDFNDLKFDYVAKMDTPDLGDLVTAKWMENWDVPDPAEGGIEEFRKVRDILRRRIERLLRGELGSAAREPMASD